MQTTLQTILSQSPNKSGWANLVLGPGELHQGKMPVAGAVPIVTLIHSSDWHICDAESPARQEYLDRWFDPDSEFRSDIGFIGTYRPQEAFTLQVAAAWIEALNEITAGPVMGRSIDAVVITGDVTDNAQQNEIDWYLTLLDGGYVDPSSGREVSHWVGSTESVTWDARYWHPEGSGKAGEVDLPTGTYGFPTIPGLLKAARNRFVAKGLKHNWFSIHGNHDALLQGTVPPDEALTALAVGSHRVIGLPANVSPLIISEAIPGTGSAKYIHDHTYPVEEVPSDDSRKFLKPSDFAKLHLSSTSLPSGHGFTAKNLSDNSAYFSARIGEAVLISIDTVNLNGGWQGSIDRKQFDWLKSQLEANKDEYVILASHHPVHCLINGFKSSDENERVLAQEFLDLVFEYPNVIAMLTGHEHKHAIYTHSRGDRSFIEINSPSLIDWPQQGRILEIAREADGTIVFISTVIDHLGEISPDFQRLSISDIAGISRLLAVNDYQRREQATSVHKLRGHTYERNFSIRIPDPFLRDENSIRHMGFEE